MTSRMGALFYILNATGNGKSLINATGIDRVYDLDKAGYGGHKNAQAEC